MEQTINNAASLLRDPPKELADLLIDDRVPEVAKNALASVTDNGPAVGEVAEEGRLQVVDEHQKFSSELPAYLAKWNLLDKGFAYDVVAIFGSQSTGKSTLLNRLFGTSFEVMEETQRQQTTKGIWMCPSKFSSTLVMDVEGTDGRERGEDQDFERKSALFSLASTEVLLVNIWEHQIGLYQGANIGLLKTVFEVNLGLFGGSPSADGTTSPISKLREKTLLLFVIRDHVGHTPLENLTKTLRQDMEKIWAGMSKPDHLASATLSDYFDLSFATLPHKVLLPEKFEESVLELRKRFTDSDRPDYVFKPGYHKRIPADGVGMYMEGIWQQVLTNKDLDLPTQQELLAQFRCDEIAQSVIEAFVAASKAVKKPVESGHVVEGLGGMMGDWRSTAVGKFDRDASRYHQGVYQRKRQDLLKTVAATLSPFFMGQLKNLHQRAIHDFRTEVGSQLKGEGHDFGSVVKAVSRRQEKLFVAGAEEIILKDTDWQYEDELELLREDVRLIANQLRADETKKMVNAIERSIKKQLAEPVEVSLSQPKATMWDDLMITFNVTLSKFEEIYLSKAKGFNCTEEENEASLENLRRRAWLALRSKIDEQLSDPAILAKLRNSFEERFRYDAGGIPRVWKPADDIDGAFKKAKEETLDLVPLYSRISTTDPRADFDIPSDLNAETSVDPDSAFDFQSSLVIFSTAKQLDLEARFRKDADAYYVEAKRSVVSSVASIPVWMYGILVVLGWNEAMTVLFNPLYFAMLLVLGATGYIVLQLGLLGPMLQVAQTVAKEVQRIGTEKLRETFAEQQSGVERPYEEVEREKKRDPIASQPVFQEK